MVPDENSGSIFSKLKKEKPAGAAPAAAFGRHEAPPQAVPPPPPPPEVLARAEEGKLAALEAVVGSLTKELTALKSYSGTLPASGTSVRDLLERLERQERVIDGLRKELAAQKEVTAGYIAHSASKDALKTEDLKISDLYSAIEELKRSFASEGELALRLERSESSVADLKALLSAQQAQLTRAMAGLAPKAAVDAVKVDFSGVVSAFEGLKKNLSEYAGEFARIESECHRAIGEMQGHNRNIEQKLVGAGFDEYLKDSVSRLNTRLAEAEKAMHASLADMSGRLSTNEALYKKIFAEAEERVKKNIEPELKEMDGRIRSLRDNVIWLTDEYKVALERKIRALEGKSSAFEAISRRMDTISEALERAGKL